MTDQQKKAVEEAAEKFAEQDLDTSAWTDHTHDGHCLIWERQNSFQYGVEEAINNPEKYGLVPFEDYKEVVKERKEAHEDFRQERKENARLRSALVKISEFHDPLGMAQEALKGGDTCKP